MDNDKLQILSEHYSHTFDILQTCLKKRDHLFITVLLLLVVILFQIYTPVEASNLIAQLIEKKLDISVKIDFLYIQSIIWFVLLSVVIKYFQSVISIERQYNYLHTLENQLNSKYHGAIFTREGQSYLNSYPLFLKLVSFLYAILFPAILALITTAKIISEYQQYCFNEILVFFNTVIYIIIVISLALSVYEIHLKSSNK